MKDLLDPKMDFVFKRIFASEENKDALLAFLNQTFADAGQSKNNELDEIILINPYTEKDTPEDKQSIFDIHAKTKHGETIIIEMQLFNTYDMEKRSLYYWSKQYSRQIQQGQSYSLLKKCITISILNFIIFDDVRYHHVFHLQEDESRFMLVDDIELHFLELTKLDRALMPTQKGLINWLLFLMSNDKSSWEVLKMNEPMLNKPMTVLEFLSQDAEARLKYEMREKYLLDQASMLAGSNKISREEGKEEGKMKEKTEIALELLKEGINIEIITRTTKLTREQIENLQKT